MTNKPSEAITQICHYFIEGTSCFKASNFANTLKPGCHEISSHQTHFIFSITNFSALLVVFITNYEARCLLDIPPYFPMYLSTIKPRCKWNILLVNKKILNLPILVAPSNSFPLNLINAPSAFYSHVIVTRPLLLAVRAVKRKFAR